MPNLDYFIIGKGPVVLFLHGWGQNKEMMKPLAEQLKHKYTCILTYIVEYVNVKFNLPKGFPLVGKLAPIGD